MVEETHKQISVVTGAASGIGEATVMRFLREGYHVAALVCSESGVSELLTTARLISHRRMLL